MKRKIFDFGLLNILLFAVFLAACTSSSPEVVEEPEDIRVVMLPYLSFGPFFIAEEEGFFAE